MSIDYHHIDDLCEKRSNGLVFDAEGVALIANCSDQLSAYRMRKQWVDTLKNYFLLETERDYDVRITGELEHTPYAVHCYFTSACGRYAFWRLINDQAPEAELRLADQRSAGQQGPLASPEFPAPEPLVLSGLRDPLFEPASLSQRVSAWFKGIFNRP